jgi:hypothetical protein
MRKLPVLLTCILTLLAVSAPDAQGQRWLQTTQLITPIQTDGPTRALLDTLIQVIDRKDGVEVRRTPEGSETLSLSGLRDKLINESGIGLNSASHVFIDYKFEIENRGFEESIEAFQFVYRAGEGQEDIQMMYIDATNPWVKNVLNNKGTTLRTNQAALKTFSDQLAFARMQEDGKIVEISGQTVREGFEAKKRNLVQKITRLTYESM